VGRLAVPRCLGGSSDWSGEWGTPIREEPQLRTGWAREGGAEGAGDLSQAVKCDVPGRVRRVGRVGEGGGLGCSSWTLTAGDFVPVPDGSE
jgi:hypothetical protein